MLPSGFRSLVVNILCRAANLGFAVNTAASEGDIMVVYGVCGASWKGRLSALL